MNWWSDRVLPKRHSMKMMMIQRRCWWRWWEEQGCTLNGSYWREVDPLENGRRGTQRFVALLRSAKYKYKLLRNIRTLHSDSSKSTKNIMCILKMYPCVWLKLWTALLPQINCSTVWVPKLQVNWPLWELPAEVGACITMKKDKI